ncbi:MAG TPA: alpha/beta hydrolase [Polyangiaceae bacterium]
MVSVASVRANGLEFSFLSEGDGPLFLCLHGFPDCNRSFRHQMGPLSAAGYRVVAPNLRGYTPGSIPAQGFYQPAALGQDTLALIRALGHERAVIYGHDWGTSAAYAAALIDPGAVERLIVSAVPYGSGMPRALVMNPAQQRRSWYLFYFQTFLAELAVPLEDYAFIEALWRDWSPGAVIDAAELRAVKDVLAAPGVLTAALAYYRTALNPALRDPALDSLEQKYGADPITVRTLYVHGERDGCIGVEVTTGMEDWFPAGFKRVVMPSVGHFVHWEDPDTFNRVVLEFLRQN